TSHRIADDNVRRVQVEAGRGSGFLHCLVQVGRGTGGEERVAAVVSRDGVIADLQGGGREAGLAIVVKGAAAQHRLAVEEGDRTGRRTARTRPSYGCGEGYRIAQAGRIEVGTEVGRGGGFRQHRHAQGPGGAAAEGRVATVVGDDAVGANRSVD